MSGGRLAFGAAVILTVGIGTGILLRAALVEDASWCRNVDWGNAPQWITLVFALVAGYLSFLGVRTAQKSHKTSQDSLDTSRESLAADARTREFAQARLVYADIAGESWMQPRETLTVPVRDKAGYEVVFVISEPPIQAVAQEIHQGSGWHIETKANQYLRVLVLVVHNNSDEVISQAGVTVNLGDGTPTLEASVGIIAPKSKAHRIIVTDMQDRNAKQVHVRFLDSTGVWWTREGGHPVRKVTPS